MVSRFAILLSNEHRCQRSARQRADKRTRALFLHTKRLGGFLEVRLFRLHALDVPLAEHLSSSTRQFVIRNESHSQLFMRVHLHL